MDGRDVDVGERHVVDFAKLPPGANLFDQVPTVPHQRESYQRYWYMTDGEETAVYVLVGLDPASKEICRRVKDAARTVQSTTTNMPNGHA